MVIGEISERPEAVLLFLVWSLLRIRRLALLLHTYLAGSLACLLPCPSLPVFLLYIIPPHRRPRRIGR